MSKDNNVIRIAHISDLHFGATSSEEETRIWDRLVTYFTDSLQPHFVLVTGDIVNTPNKDLYTRSKRHLDRLVLDGGYRVCPGNHDRFTLGNKLFASTEYVFSIKDAPFFDQTFSGKVLVPHSSYTKTFREPGNEWRCRFLGCDTSDNDKKKYFAQGAVDGGTIDALRKSALDQDEEGKKIDIVFLLLHHHLLPIPALETTVTNLSSLVNFTGLLNSGRLLNSLAESHVNIALHGHEHHSSVARFGTLSGLQGQVVVVAAGSATGTETGIGWDIKRTRFNVIELHPDRTVKLKKITYDSTSERLVDHAEEVPIALLSAEDVRRASFLRQCARERSTSLDTPRSRISKFFDFRDNRDILITETRTECIVENTYVTHTCNRSGFLTDAAMDIEWYTGASTEQSSEFKRTNDGNNSYEAVFANLTGDDRIHGVRRLSKQWKWNCGAVFSVEEIKSIPDSGEFRKENREFVAAFVDIDLEELNILVKLPEQFAPDVDEICVFTQLDNDKAQPHESLRKHVNKYGNGIFNLRIPYPYKRYKYILSWPVVTKLPVDKRDSAIAKNIRDASSQILTDIMRILGEWKIPETSNVALYLPLQNKIKINVLECVTPRNLSPETLSLQAVDSLARAAWWGRLRIWAPEDSDSQITSVHGETLIALVPIGFGRTLGGSAAALLRIGLQTATSDIEEQAQALESTLEHVSAHVLERCFNRNRT
ncbi:metallophosphoesterase family protein [Nitrosospira lacus]|nr:metallophosphoesterase [Nitrosospira lacus]